VLNIYIFYSSVTNQVTACYS